MNARETASGIATGEEDFACENAQAGVHERSGGLLKDGKGTRVFVRLRNGNSVEVGAVTSLLIFVEHLQESNPEVFSSLISAVRMGVEQCPPEKWRMLCDQHLVGKSNDILVDLKNVLISSIRETRDGIVLASPVDSIADQLAIKDARKRTYTKLKGILRNRYDGPDR